MRRVLIVVLMLFLVVAPARAQSPASLRWSPSIAAAETRKLDAAIARLAPQRPGARDIYIVAAALWDDPVFQHEAQEGGAILAKHFGAEQRLLLLSNANRPGEGAVPSASPDALRRALRAAAARLDANEDILLLFITTHGSPDGLALRQGFDQTATIGPDALARDVAASGAKTRVIILSACYSGIFVPALQGPDAIIMTAASSDRPSFGCQPDNDWTYFGEALFANSLSRGRNLLQAFAEARALVQLRELKERLAPSNPQLAVGDAAALALRAAEQTPARQ